jgi:outer membrane protein insertion porin family
MKRIAALLLLAWFSQDALAFDNFTISEIRVDGLSRIAPGTVFTYLPVERGDTLTSERAAASVRALYKTGFFNDVSLSHQGDILIITVKERPQISKIAIRGNKDVQEDDLRKGLKGIGLVEGESFDPLKLDEVQGELTRQYYNRGKYNVSVKTSAVNLDRNRVEVSITIAEGKAAQIKHINIVGNHTFSDHDIRKEFESNTTGWLSWYTKNDQYSREKLSGDLEKLTSYYMDRGYVDFNVDSTEVSISPDKRRIYVDADISEGTIYNVGDIKLTGELILNEADLRKLITVQPGELFSRRKVEASADAITSVLANIGYAFAEVHPIPDIDKDKHIVGINFNIEPGKRVYVRRIVFSGNAHTEDEVLRREMRQLEGAWYSQAAIDRSKIRLQRLGYFSNVTIDTPKVPGTDDQIDVDVTVAEENSGSFQFGVGYSQVQGVIASISVQQDNFFGTGDRVGVTVAQSSFIKRYELSYYEPYLTDDGLGLGYNLRHTELDQGQANIASYLTNTDSFSTYLGIPISESDTVNTQLGLSQTAITVFPGITPASFINYLVQVGHRTFHAVDAQLSWAHDTRNKYWNPTRGSLQTLSLEATLPGATVEYYKLNYRFGQYFPLNDTFTFYGHFNIGYGDSYGKIDSVDNLHNSNGDGDKKEITGLPFFENFFAGGVTDVRGFRDNTLGPYEVLDPTVCPSTNSRCRQPLGGAFKTVGSAEVIFPLPWSDADDDRTRLSWFVDVGNVFKDYGAFDVGELRASTGISLHWRAPVGPIVINVAKPLRSEKGDDTEVLQFTFGNTF